MSPGRGDWKRARLLIAVNNPPDLNIASLGDGVSSGSAAGPATRVADNAEDFRFAEVWASYTYGNSPQSGKPPHYLGPGDRAAGAIGAYMTDEAGGAEVTAFVPDVAAAAGRSGSGVPSAKPQHPRFPTESRKGRVGKKPGFPALGERECGSSNSGPACSR